MKIIENLWQVGGDHLSGPGDAAIYLVRSGNQAALIDAGCGHGRSAVVENVTSCLSPDVRVGHLLLTHCHFDHTGGAEALRTHYGCDIVAHAADAVYLERGDDSVTAAGWYGANLPPLKIDRKLESAMETITIGHQEIIAHHTPGHSPGSVVYVAVIGSRTILFGQDIHGPLHPSLLSDRTAYRRSLKFLMDLNADILCEGHFGVMRGKKAVRDFILGYL